MTKEFTESLSISEEGKTVSRFVQRNRMEIITSLLSLCREGSRKTRLIYRCNLSFSQFNRYIDYLIDGGLLKKAKEQNHDVFYTTKRGVEFLNDYEKIQKILDGLKM